MKLKLVPMTFKEANQFVEELHRHNDPAQGYKFCLGAAFAGKIVGVAIVGHPNARLSCDDWTVEILRTCTDGTRNANSFLYGACLRAAWALGYEKVLTYSEPTESGASLRAAGFRCVSKTAGGGTWSRPSRPRVDTHPLQQKLKWEAIKNASCEATASPARSR